MSAEATQEQVRQACSRLEDSEPTERVTFRAPESMVDRLDELVESDVVPNRSEVIRAGVQRELDRIEWGESDGE